MVNRALFLIIMVAATAASAASTKYYWDFPETTALESDDRILVYKGYSTPSRDRNIKKTALADSILKAGRSATLNNVSASTLKIASHSPASNQLEVGSYSTQSFSADNSFMSVNSVYNGFLYRRNAGYAGLFQFYPAGFRILLSQASGVAGSSWESGMLYPLSIDRSGWTTLTYGAYVPNLTGAAGSGGNIKIKSNGSGNGYIQLGGTSAYDEALSRLGIGTQSPAASLDIVSTTGNGVSISDLGYRAKGTATTWNDLRIEPNARTGSGTGTAPTFKPSFGTTGAGGVYSYAFAQTAGALEYLYYTLQTPHDWREGSAVKPHVHFSSAATSGTVKFKGTCYGANYTGTFAAFGNWSSTTTLTGAAWKHNIAEGTSIDMTGKAISTIMNCNIYRKAGDTAAADTHVHYIDYHYETDSLGSDNEYTKTATP